MTFKHLTENPREQARAWNIPLGVPGFRYADLNRVRRLEALDRAFGEALRGQDQALSEELAAYRAGRSLDKLDESKLLMRAAPHLGNFVARLFHVEAEHDALCARVRADEVIFKWKRNVVERRVFKDRPTPEDLGRMDPAVLESAYREVVDSLMLDQALSADPERELAEVTTALEEAAEGGAAGREGAAARMAAVMAWTRALAFH